MLKTLKKIIKLEKTMIMELIRHYGFLMNKFLIKNLLKK